MDDTLCPKWGRKIFGAGFFFDHVRRPRPGYIWGHNWVVLAAVVRLFGAPVALPFWVALYRSEKTCPKEEFRTRLQIVEEALRKAQSWVSVPIMLVADGAYNNQSLLKPLAELKIPLVARLRVDAALRRDPPKRRKPRRGRKPKYGPRLASLSNLARARRGWETIRAAIYGKIVTLRVKCFDAWWAQTGIRIRVVIVRDPSGKRSPCFFSSTDRTLSALQIVERFACRWSIEQLFSDAKLLLGLDTAEVRSQKSVLRHAILSFALATWVRVWAKAHFARRRERPTSLAGQMTELRSRLLAQTIFVSIPSHVLSPRITEDLARLAVA